jgi:predicted Fe-Mo cluster-binding NifX family protein
VRVAVPVFNDLVSPRLDCAAAFDLFEVAGGEAARIERVDVDRSSEGSWLRMLRARGVQVLICGGIRRRDVFAAQGEGLELFVGHRGGVAAVLRAYVDGRLEQGLEPGWGLGPGRGCPGGGRGPRAGHGPRPGCGAGRAPADKRGR